MTGMLENRNILVFAPWLIKKQRRARKNQFDIDLW